MGVVRITKRFRFEAAHALDRYDGLCREIHGHSYVLEVTVRGEPCSDPSAPHEGMVLDFGRLKTLVEEQIVRRMDHALVLRGSPQNASLLAALGERFHRIVVVDYPPTCEQLILDFARRLRDGMPSGTELCRLRLHETATSFAEWLAEENPR